MLRLISSHTQMDSGKKRAHKWLSNTTKSADVPEKKAHHRPLGQ
jgi:hypothetical protein